MKKSYLWVTVKEYLTNISRIVTLTSKLLSLAFLLVLAQEVSATSVIYSITSNDLVLNNPNGTWAGDLNIGAGQNVNLTVAYQFEANSSDIIGNKATFIMEGLQVFDNTNGLASAFIGTGSITITYDISDFITESVLGSPGGAFHALAFEFGNVGDPLPTGTAFDLMIEETTVELVARGFDSHNDNISGANGATLYNRNTNFGDFTFHSRVVPVPAAVWLFGSGLIGLIGVARRKKA